MDLTKAFKDAEKALQILWTGTATVSNVSGYEKDPVTKVERPKKEIIYSEIPCHLSFNSTGSETEYKATTQTAEMILFVSPEIRIPANSEIEVKQSGETFRLTNERLKPYKSHNEYEVKEFESWSRYGEREI